jgi:hypothetical protein
VRKQRVVLEHHADAARLGRQMHAAAASDSTAVHGDAPGVAALQPGHGAQQRRLAAARRADQHADLARRRPS